MEKSKIKNVIIVILVAVDLALLCLMLRDIIGDRKLHKQARENVVSVLYKNGIEIEKSAIPEDKDYFEYRAERNVDCELACAEKLLGKCTVTEQGGNIYCYIGEKGEMSCRGSGDFDILFKEKVSVETVNSVLKEYGICISGDNDGSYCANQQIFGCEILNCPVNVDVTDGKVSAIEGRWLLTEDIKETDAEMMTPATVLMRFAAMETGIKKIDSISVCYEMTAQASGEFSLEPVWTVRCENEIFKIELNRLYVTE